MRTGPLPPQRAPESICLYLAPLEIQVSWGEAALPTSDAAQSMAGSCSTEGEAHSALSWRGETAQRDDAQVTVQPGWDRQRHEATTETFHLQALKRSAGGSDRPPLPARGDGAGAAPPGPAGRCGGSRGRLRRYSSHHHPAVAQHQFAQSCLPDARYIGRLERLGAVEVKAARTAPLHSLG